MYILCKGFSSNECQSSQLLVSQFKIQVLKIDYLWHGENIGLFSKGEGMSSGVLELVKRSSLIWLVRTP